MGESKNKGGRPKGSGTKYEYLGMKISEEQKEKLRKYAEQKGMSMSEVIDRFISGLNIESEPEENP